MPTPKKSGHPAGSRYGQLKQTNEIKTAIPLLDALDIQGKDITADALLTQRAIAEYLVTSAMLITILPSKQIRQPFWEISPYSSRIGGNPTSLSVPLVIMAGSKSEKYGLQPSLTRTLTSPT